MFDEKHEEILYNHAKALDVQMMVVNKAEFLKLAYQFIVKLENNHRLSKENQIGKGFYYDFMS